ncbi:MAG: ATP synthase F1 subunit delta [Planctomycetales bacterium]|nr:ATP synthase F1 subunit delta [Planctomycetales bacterium]
MTDQPQHETALDSDQQQVGALYAKALLQTAGQSVDNVLEELESVVRECLDVFPALEQALASPRLSPEHKEGMLDRIFSGRVDRALLNFMKVLCRRGRIDCLRAIQVTASELRQEQLGRMKVIVTSSQPLSDQQRSMVAEQLNRSFGKESVLTERIDPSLLGGIVVRIGDKVLDGSVQGKLEAIRRSVTSSVQQSIRNNYESLLTT